METVLITGVTGFVGANLKPYLESDYKVIGVSRSPNKRESVIEYSEIKKTQYDFFIHLAGKAHDTGSNSEYEEYFQANTELTKKVFDDFLKSDARDFIYFSSVKAVADTLSDILTEETTANPKTAYGKSKHEAEKYLLSKTLPASKRLFIIRPCMIHGPGNKGNLNLLYKMIKKGIPYPLAKFENKRSFLSIGNLLFIIHKIINNPDIPGGVYQVADDEPLSTNEVVRIIGKANGKGARLWPVPITLVNATALIGDKLSLSLNSERLKKLTENYIVSNKKIKKELGINLLPISSREGLMETVKSY